LARRRQIRWWKTEWVLLLLSHVGLGALLWYAMGLWAAVVFYAIQQGALGLYLGLLFAPNHLGMPVLPAGPAKDYLWRQLITTRNLRPHPLTDYVWGPLAYQIEHHLFPRIPFNRLREARSIVKPFCEERGLPYHEVGAVASFVEVLRALHRASAPLRRQAN
jgi:fatty acid desaturase